MNVDHGGSRGLAAGCVLRKEKRKCMTTHRCTLAAEPADSQHPGAEEGTIGGMWWAGLAQRDVRCPCRTKGKGMEAGE